MNHLAIDSLDIDELYCLQKDLAAFLDAYFAAELLYCEGNYGYEYARELSERTAEQLRSRLKGLAISWGIHSEFLEQYSKQLAQQGLKLTAA